MTRVYKEGREESIERCDTLLFSDQSNVICLIHVGSILPRGKII
jgi:hypothetical protein